MFRRSLSLWLIAGSSWAGPVNIEWTNPVENVADEPLTDHEISTIYWDTVPDPWVFGESVEVPAAWSTFTINPGCGDFYIAMTATNVDGGESAPSNTVLRNAGPCSRPADVPSVRVASLFVPAPPPATGYTYGGPLDARTVPFPLISPTDFTITVQLHALGGAGDQRIFSQSEDGTAEEAHYLMLSLSFDICLPRLRVKIAGNTRTLIGQGTCVQAGDTIVASYDGQRMRVSVNDTSYGSLYIPGEAQFHPTKPLHVGEQPIGTKTFEGSFSGWLE